MVVGVQELQGSTSGRQQLPSFFLEAMDFLRSAPSDTSRHRGLDDTIEDEDLRSYFSQVGGLIQKVANTGAIKSTKTLNTCDEFF